MGDVATGMTQMVILFIIVILGYVISKLGYIDKPFFDKVSRLLMDVTMPCLVLASVGDLDGAGNWGLVFTTIAVCVIGWFVWIVSGYLIGRLLRVKTSERSLYAFMASFCNVGFMGLPLISVVFGGEAVLTASIFVLFCNLLGLSIGMVVLNTGPAMGEEESADKQEFKIPWRAMVQPAVISAVVAIVMFLAGIHLPYVAQESLSLVGSITGPLAMLVIGYFLSTVKFTELLKEWRMYPFIVLRQLGVSVALVTLASFFVQHASVLAALALMSCMPVGSMVPIFAAQYKQDAVLASKFVVATTVASFAVVPVLLVLLSVL